MKGYSNTVLLSPAASSCRASSLTLLQLKPQQLGTGYSLGSSLDAQFSVYPPGVSLYRVQRNKQLICNLLIGMAPGNQAQNLQLTLTEQTTTARHFNSDRLRNRVCQYLRQPRVAQLQLTQRLMQPLLTAQRQTLL